MVEKTAQTMQLTEENVVTKVADLMETLDQVKKYNALSGSLKKFALIVVGSFIIFFVVAASIGFINLVVPLDRPHILLGAFLSLLIPIGGIAAGVFYIRKRVNSIKMGEWKGELSGGFPSAIKILTELNWDETFEEISAGRVGYIIYSFMKAFAYWIITIFTVGLVGNVISFFVLREAFFGGPPLLWLISFLVVYLLLRKDFARRYRQIRALDNLLWELRWFSVELRRAEF